MRLSQTIAKGIHKLLSRKENSGEDSFVQKTYGDNEDTFFGEANDKLKEALGLNKTNKESYQKDLKRFGTRIGLIDVADDAVKNKRRKDITPTLKGQIQGRKCFKEKYEEDLKRFGTSQGIIDVSNDECEKKKKIVGGDIKAAYKKMMSRCKPQDVLPFSANPYSDIFRDCPKLQVTIHNQSPFEKEVVLWGANQNISVSPPAPGDVQDHTIITQISVPSGVHPQGIAVNPANNLVYVANQLSGTVTVIDSSNQVVKQIQLQPTFPGTSSPVALAVNTNSSSSKYGFVYVVGSVSNTVSVIDLALNVVAEIPVENRPLAIAFNNVNNLLYVVNLHSASCSVLDPETNAPIPGPPLPAGVNPITIGINPINGEIYIASYFANILMVYDINHVLVATIIAVQNKPRAVTYNPANDSMYAVVESGFIYQIDPVSHTIINTIPAGLSPRNIFFNTTNNFLYVQNAGDNTFTVIRPDNSKVDGLSFGEQNVGGAYNGFNNSIYVSDTSNNSINVIGYLAVSSTIIINSDYPETREDFQSNPAIIQHTKFVVTGLERLNSFRVNKFNPTGTTSSKPISFELYASPQSRLNVAEVSELAGTVIDGKMNWRFKLPGLHSVSVLIWYRQFEVKDLL